MQHDAADELNIIVAKADRAHRRLTHEGKRLDHDVIKGCAVLYLRFEVGGFGLHLLGAELLHARFKRVDLIDGYLVDGKRFLHGVAEDLLDDVTEHSASRGLDEIANADYIIRRRCFGRCACHREAELQSLFCSQSINWDIGRRKMMYRTKRTAAPR